MQQLDPELAEAFLSEAKEHLNELEPALIELEKDYSNKEIIHQIFRCVHSLKGSSGFLGLNGLTKLSHTMENLIALLREGKLTVDENIISILLEGTDILGLMISDIDRSESLDNQKIIRKIENITINDTLTNTEQNTDTNPIPTEQKSDILEQLHPFNPPEEIVNQSLDEGHLFYIIKLYLKEDIQSKQRSLIDLLKDIEPLGEIIDSYVNADKITGLDNALEQEASCEILFSTMMQQDLMIAIVEVSERQITLLNKETITKWLPLLRQNRSKGLLNESIHENLSKAEDLKNKNTLLNPESSMPYEGSVRVSVSLLDDLMNLAGEMVLARNQLVNATLNGNQQGSDLSSILQKINLVTSELQEKVMFTRLQALDVILSKFKRLVRDLARKLDKKINVQTQGEHVELDKSVIEKLSDPLTHIIRNCVDHGIEPPSQRTTLGKPPEGVISISAHHAGGQVRIEIEDDGRGIDPQWVKNEAIKKNLVSAQEVEGLSSKELQQLIFLPGFTTAKEVTNISGRGVGMDVAQTNIEELGGTIELFSEAGVGTKISIQVPMSLAIIPAMVIASIKQKFAIPQINIQEIIKIGKKHFVQYLHESYVLQWGDELLPIVDLNTLLSKGKPFFQENTPCSEKQGFVIVLKIDQYKYGLLTDNLLDTEEIVVKPLSSHFKKLPYYSGATILGDGSVIMILDTSGIAQICKIHAKSIYEHNTKKENKKPTSIEERQNILLFKNGTSETFALNLDIVLRIKMIRPQDIEKMGSKEYLKHEDGLLRVIRLHDYMEIEKEDYSNYKKLYVIIPKLIPQPMGIIVTQVEDITQTPVNLDKSTMSGVGILGSTVLNNKVTVFLDIYSLCDAVYPDHKLSKENLKRFKNKRVLVAEDTPFFRTVSQKFLSNLVGSIDIVNDGLEAWEKIQNEPYDLVLTDIEMPCMNGLELTQKIKSSEKLKHIPVVALTSFSNPKDELSAKEAGVDGYEVKLNKEHLQNTLKNLLN